jgi:hypothetical protein
MAILAQRRSTAGIKSAFTTQASAFKTNFPVIAPGQTTSINAVMRINVLGAMRAIPVVAPPLASEGTFAFISPAAWAPPSG